MTIEQKEIFTKLLGAIKDADNTSNNYRVRDNARQDYYDLKRELMNSMGSIEYSKFAEEVKLF